MNEPSINRNLEDLDPAFREKLLLVLAELGAANVPFKFHEGFRTSERQRFLYGQGRQKTIPFGRPGAIVTQKDGVRNLSNHQGTGSKGTGRAADCYPLDKSGNVIVNPPEAIWERYATVAESHGLVSGHRWTNPHDSPHVEMKKG